MSNEIEKEEHEYPNIVERFREVFQKLGIKKHEGYVDHCAKGDLEDLEDVEQKLYEMGLHPSLRNQVINFWATEIKQPVPQKLQKRLAEERGTKPRQEGREEKAPEKYSVDTVTGAIRAAMTTDKMALTWDEAEKLSNTIKKELAEKAKKGEKKVTYVYDTVDRVVRMAKEGEVGGTMEQAKELKKMAEEGGKGAEESPFIPDKDGNWTLNPKARVTGIELMALDAIRKAQERGEPVEPLEALSQAAERMKIFREALGGGGAQLPEWMRDPLQFQKTIQELTPKGEGDALKELREEITKLREDQHQAELKRRDEQNASLVTVIQEYRGEVLKLRDEIEKNKMATGRTAYDLLGDLVEKVPNRDDVRAMVMEAVGKGPKLLPRGTGERAQVLEGMATGIEHAAELKSIEDWWWRLG